jgi:Putative Flp pilus-assembly TadE/G-like
MMHHRPGNAGASDRSDRAGRRAAKIVCLSGRLGHLAKRFLGEGRGNIAITFALSIAVVFGAVGLGTSAASWYSQKRDMQNAADLAAASAINSLKANVGGLPATIEPYAYNEARSSTAYHGFTHGSSSVTVTPITPPSTGPYTASSYRDKAIEVTVTKPAPLGFASLFMTSGPTIAARAVALLNYDQGDCMVALSPHQDMAFQVIGSSSLTVDCSIAISSDNAGSNGSGQRNVALYMQGGNGVVLRAYDVTVNGGWGGPGNATVSATNSFTYNTHQPAPNPYSGLVIPSTCSCTTYTANSMPTSLSGGGIINGDINLSSNLTLSGGTYIVNGNINITSGGTLTTSGATIILNSTSTTNYTFNMQSANANAILDAPSTGDLKGMALIQSPSAPTDVIDNNGNCSVNCSVFQGGPTTGITGAVYMPKGNLSFQGNPTATQGCTQLIADTMSYQGNPLYVNACEGTGVTPFGPVTTAMVE